MKKHLFIIPLLMKRIRLMVAGMALVLTAMTAKAENTFPFAVFEKMQQTVDGNIIVSPFSLEQAIGMVANGAKGTTQDELLALTGDSSLSALNARNQQMAALLTTYQSDTLSSMHVANSVWHVPAMNLMAPFRDSVLTRYNAYIDTANFATEQGIDTVNAWVCRHTDSLIEKILQEPDSSLLLTLINTTLFHGTWMWGYNPYEIGVRPFRNADGTGTNVEMIGISSQSTMVVYLDYDLVGIGLDFVGEDFGSHYHVMFILPRDYQNMVALTAERWHTLLNNRQYKYMYVQVPKFDVSCTEEMLSRLQEMGAFVGSDFSGIAEGAFVSSVKHSTRMILNEKGMSAAAVTVIEMTNGMPDPIDYTDFIINRPFYVAIMADGTDEPVFLAKIKQLDGAACEAPAAPYLTLGVDNRKASATPTKILRDGHIYISTPIGTFNATGKLVE